MGLRLSQVASSRVRFGFVEESRAKQYSYGVVRLEAQARSVFRSMSYTRDELEWSRSVPKQQPRLFLSLVSTFRMMVFDRIVKHLLVWADTLRPKTVIVSSYMKWVQPLKYRIM